MGHEQLILGNLAQPHPKGNRLTLQVVREPLSGHGMSVLDDIRHVNRSDQAIPVSKDSAIFSVTISSPLQANR